jgi:hypothetical protein
LEEGDTLNSIPVTSDAIVRSGLSGATEHAACALKFMKGLSPIQINRTSKRLILAIIRHLPKLKRSGINPFGAPVGLEPTLEGL